MEITITHHEVAPPVDGSVPFERWNKDPETAVNVRLKPSVPQEPQFNSRPSAESQSRPRISGTVERSYPERSFGHSQSRSLTSSANNHSTHRSRHSFDLSSSVVQQLGKVRSSGHLTDPGPPATRDGESLAPSAVGLETQPMSEDLKGVSSRGDFKEVENTANLPKVINVSPSSPPSLTNESSSSGESYIRSLDNSTNNSAGAGSI